MMQNFEWLQFKRPTPNAEQVRISVTVDGKSNSPRMALVIGLKVAGRLKWSKGGKVQVAFGKAGTSDFGTMLVASVDENRPADPLTLSSDGGPSSSTVKISTAVIPSWLTREKLPTTECTFKIEPNKWLEIKVPPAALAVVEDDVKEAGAEPVDIDPAALSQPAETKVQPAQVLAIEPMTKGDTLHVPDDAFEPKNEKENTGAVQLPEKAPCTHGVGAAPDRKSETVAPQDSSFRKGSFSDIVWSFLAARPATGRFSMSNNELGAATGLTGQQAANAMTALKRAGLVRTSYRHDSRLQTHVRIIEVVTEKPKPTPAPEKPAPKEKQNTADRFPVDFRRDPQKRPSQASLASDNAEISEHLKTHGAKRYESGSLDAKVWDAVLAQGKWLTFSITTRSGTKPYKLDNRPMSSQQLIRWVNAWREQAGLEPLSVPKKGGARLEIYGRGADPKTQKVA